MTPKVYLKRQPSDLGSADLERHVQVRLEPVSPLNPAPRRRVLDQRVIDRLVLDGKLSGDQWSAAQRLWRMAYSAGWSGNLESHLRKLQVIDFTPDNYTDRWDAAKDLADLLDAVRKAHGFRKAKLLIGVVIEDEACTVAARAARLSPGKSVQYVAEMLEWLVQNLATRA